MAEYGSILTPAALGLGAGHSPGPKVEAFADALQRARQVKEGARLPALAGGSCVEPGPGPGGGQAGPSAEGR